jgi:tRNA 2-thiocytidine biosynthesis protein TtcA
VKKMLHEWERQYPGRTENMLSAMAHIVPSHMMDRNLHPFATLQASGVADANGDRAFDDDESCATPAPQAVVRFDVLTAKEN